VGAGRRAAVGALTQERGLAEGAVADGKREREARPRELGLLFRGRLAHGGLAVARVIRLERGADGVSDVAERGAEAHEVVPELAAEALDRLRRELAHRRVVARELRGKGAGGAENGQRGRGGVADLAADRAEAGEDLCAAGVGGAVRAGAQQTRRALK
jgi:hypothetical protein